MNVSYVMPKLLISLLLVLLTSCAVQPVNNAPDFLFPGKVVKKHTRAMPPRVAERAADKSKTMLKVAAPSFVVQPEPLDVSTNTISLDWQHPPGYVSGPSVASYNLYVGVSSGIYGPPISVPNVNDTTNYVLSFVDQGISTNPPLDLIVLPNGMTYTNAYNFYFALSAVGVVEGSRSKEISWPGPPWNSLLITWDLNRPITLLRSTDFKNWTTATNVAGTNAIVLPITGTNYFYRAVTTNPPPVQLHINGEYIAP